MSAYVYILASRRNGTLYIGVTTNLAARLHSHRIGRGSAFVKTYRVHRLVYVEAFDDVRQAIQREKTMKERPRAWKLRTIEAANPLWEDLFADLNR